MEERIRFIQSDLLEGDLLHAKFDLVCANLPYIPSDTLRGLEVYDREPSLVLDGGAQGLDLIGRLLAQLGEMRLAECLVLLEIEARQGVAVSDLAHFRFPLAEVRVLRDLAGFDRLVMIET